MHPEPRRPLTLFSSAPPSQNHFLIATKTVSADVYVFDYSKHPSKPAPDGLCKPDIRLAGHKNEGYGLSWSQLQEGYLLSGSDDAQICVWDVKGTTQSNRVSGGGRPGPRKTVSVVQVSCGGCHDAD